LSRRQFTWQELLQALTVDVIRRLWDSGQYRQNKWCKAIVEQWFFVWVEWKTDLTMRDVDQMAEQIFDDWYDDKPDLVDDYLYTEVIEGETPLGGEMRLTARWEQEDEQ
jgi:hypothetical protein